MPHMQIYQAWSLVQVAEGKRVGKNATLGKEVSQQKKKYSVYSELRNKFSLC